MRPLTLPLAMLVLATSSIGQAQEAMSQAPQPTTEAFQVQSEASWLRVLAYPDGPLRRFGHHHVISHDGISGVVELAPNPTDSTLMLEVAVADLEVDNAELRKLEGEDFEKEVSQKDIDGTRANMLGEKLLNGEEFPAIQIRSSEIRGSLPDLEIVATVSVIGQENTVTFPARVELADDAFIAKGELEITHGELGLSPFKAAGGALSVRDLLVLKYEIAGVRVANGD